MIGQQYQGFQRVSPSVIFSVLLCLLSVGVATSCTPPSGVGTGPGEISVAHVQTTKSTLNLPYLFLPLADTYIGALVSKFETPIQFRLANLHGFSIYNTVAMYDATALDIWGLEDKRICTAGLTEDVRSTYETIAGAYAFAYSTVRQNPETLATVDNIMTNVLGLPYSNLDGTPGLDTPWGLAKATIDEALEHAKSDGWNADGSLTNMFNKQPYADFNFEDTDGDYYEEYTTQQSRGALVVRRNGQCRRTPNPWYWEPLLESDGNGFFTRQEHVTPYIGFTGRLFGVTEQEFFDQESPIPTYNYCDEADFVLEQTRVLATSDQEKMEVELYDSKFTSILPQQIGWSIQSGFSEFEFWYFDMVLVIAMYDATMLVWRDKVLFDRVRPTTVVHEVKRDFETLTYAGPTEGAQSVKGVDWQPYIRTMPHAEYPSGSACVCTAFAETLQTLTGTDDTGVPIVQPIAAGSSILEPGVTPATDLTFTYTKWSEIQRVCGDSRENGGMHFSEAVPGGEALCSGLAEKVVEKAELLRLGYPGGAMADINDETINVRLKSYRRFNGFGSSS